MLSVIQSRLAFLESENSVSRRRVKELELELEACKQEVARERTRILALEVEDVERQQPFVMLYLPVSLPNELGNISHTYRLFRTPFNEPVTTRTCSHTFCQGCILQAISISAQCPIDRSPLSLDFLVQADPIIRHASRATFFPASYVLILFDLNHFSLSTSWLLNVRTGRRDVDIPDKGS